MLTVELWQECSDVPRQPVHFGLPCWWVSAGCATVALWGRRSALNRLDDEISMRFRISRPLNSAHMSQVSAA